MVHSIFELNEPPTRWQGLTDRQKRAWLSLIIGGLTAGLPLAYVLVLSRRADREWRPLADYLVRLAFWPDAVIGRLYEHFFPTYADPDVCVLPLVSDGILLISVTSLLISMAVYSMVSFIMLTWWSRRRRIA